MYTESLKIALCQMVNHGFCSGGGKGYISIFSDFLDVCASNTQPTQQTSTNSNIPMSNAHFIKVEVEYNHPTLSVAAQIELEVMDDINTSTEIMVPFLMVGMGIDESQLSPFAKHFKDFTSLAHTYYFYLPTELQKELSEHTYTNEIITQQNLNKTTTDEDDIIQELQTDTLPFTYQHEIQDTPTSNTMYYLQFIPHQLSVTKEYRIAQESSENPWMNLVTTMSMITKHRKNDDVNEVVSNRIKQILYLIAECIGGTKMTLM